MTLFFQLASAGAIIAAIIAWFNWIADTSRSVQRPTHLGVVDVHGVQDNASEPLSRAIGAGIAGEISKHRMIVHQVNSASLLKSEAASLELMRLSEKTPEFIGQDEPSQDLDLSVEFAGSKIDAKGLQSIFKNSKSRGRLNLSFIVDSSGTGTYNGRVSATFSENPRYNFSIEVSGSTSDISHQIAMRYLQAYYSEEVPGNEFFRYSDPDDFREVWNARLNAARIAQEIHESESVDPKNQEQFERAVLSARESYDEYSDLFNSYRGREDIQKLASYLALASEQYDAAIAHLNALLTHYPDGSVDKIRILALIAGVKADQATEVGSLIEQARKVSDLLNNENDIATKLMAIRSQQGNRVSGLSLQVEKVGPRPAGVPPTKVAIVAGGFHPSAFQGLSVQPASEFDIERDLTNAGEYTSAIGSIVAALAPEAEIFVYRVPVIQNDRFNSVDLAESLERAITGGAQIILLPIDTGAFDRNSVNGELLHNYLSLASNENRIVVISAGHNQRSEPQIGHDLPGVVYVGAWAADNQRAEFSNFGDWIEIYGPEASLVVQNGELAEVRGTGPAAAVVASVMANMAMLDDLGFERDRIIGGLKDAAKTVESTDLTELLLQVPDTI